MKEPLALILILMAAMFVVVFVCRMWSIRCGTVRLSHYELLNLNPVPTYVTKATNNLNNLFQLPLVFIAACVLAISLTYQSDGLIFNAWGFVAARFVHTAIHLTVKQVLPRSVAFAASMYFLVVLWLELLSII